MTPTNRRKVVDGLVYLERNSLQHGQLRYSKILVDITGNAKICESSGP